MNRKRRLENRAYEIVRVAEELGAGLIVLGSRGLAGSLALLVPYLRGLQEGREKPALSRRGLKGGLG